MKSKNEKCKTGIYSIEKLHHFKCGICAKWWSVGDAPTKKEWFCPWCGSKQKVVKLK